MVAVMNTPSSLLKIRITDIPDQGLTLTGDIEPAALGLGPGEASFHGPLAFTARVQRFDKDLTVRGELTGTPIRQCVRCLKDYEAMLRLPFATAFRRDERPGRGPGGAAQVDVVDVDEEEVYLYAGDWLELSNMLREQLILATPMQPLCKPDCLGLCPTCGIDLNERQCSCPAEQGASPFQALRDLFESRDQPSPPSGKADRIRKPE
jgi:uncharacterized protein